MDWCDSTWSPVTGCRNGCEYCYARSIVNRYKGYDAPGGKGITTKCPLKRAELSEPLTVTRADGKERKAPYPFGFEPTLHRYKLDIPRKWKKPRTIFVCSMADLFGEWVPDFWIEEVFEACKAAPQHRYIFLTKHPARLIEYAQRHPGEINCNGDKWLFGTTVNVTADMSGRGLDLANFAPYFKSGDRFLSIEPIQEAFTGTALHNLSCFDWIIVGAETGNRKGRVKPPKAWIDAIAEVCTANGVPIFMKESLRELMGADFRQELPWPTLQAKSCAFCKWLTDEFTSVCFNDESERCADFVSDTDTCEHWEQRQEGGTDSE